MSIAAGSFAALMGGLKVAARRHELPPEVSRKFVHIGMGLVAAAFPWLFAQAWPVWVLSAGFGIALAAIRFFEPLRQRLGRILGGVERRSWGEFYFPVAVAGVFTLAHEQRDRYVISILVLALADAAAALFGGRFGETKYRTDEGWKSIEGSLALFLVALLSAAGPGMWMTDQSVTRVLIMATCIGVLAALVEAISWRGLDNLFLPLATLVMLTRFAEYTNSELLGRAVVALGLFGLMLLWRRRTTLRDDALAAVTLALYVFWTVGGWLWLQAPLTVALAYTFLPFRPRRTSADVHGTHIVLCLAAAGLIWLFLEGTAHEGNYQVPYVLSFTAQLSMIFLARWKRGRPETSVTVVIPAAAFAAWLILYVPAALTGLAGGTPAAALVALAVVTALTLFFARIVRPVEDMPNTPGRWLSQAGVALVGSSAGLLPIFKS